MKIGDFLFLCFLYTVATYPLNYPVYASEPDNFLYRAKKAIEEKHYSQAEHFLEQWLLSNINDWDAKYLLARVYAWQKMFQKSHEIYNELLSRYPDNSDYLLGKAQVHTWSNNPRLALPLLANARKLSPTYREVWRLELQTLKSLPDDNSEGLYKSLLKQAKQQFSGEDWLTSFTEDKLKNNKSQILFGAGGKYDNLSDNFASWQSYEIEVIHKNNKQNSLYSKLRTTKRFGLKDREIEIGAYYDLNRNWFFNIGSSYSPSYNVLPHWSLHAYMGRTFLDGYNIQIGDKFRNYVYVDATSTDVIFERYINNYRFRYTLHVIAIDGKTIEKKSELSHSVDVVFYYTETSSIGCSLAKGEELEYDGSLNALVTNVKHISIHGTHWLQSSNWAPKYQFEYQQQGKIYSRYGIYIGLLYKL